MKWILVLLLMASDGDGGIEQRFERHDYYNSLKACVQDFHRISHTRREVIQGWCVPYQSTGVNNGEPKT